jgi:hypothetical protein
MKKLNGIKHMISPFKDSVVYVATTEGMYRVRMPD